MTTWMCVLAARSRPSFATTKPKTRPLAQRKARGAERRKTQSNQCPPRKQVGARGAACLRSGRRRAAECAACATPLLSGRARLPAHRCGSRQGFDTLTQLQAMLPGQSAQRALPAGSQAQCRDSTSRRGRSTAGRDARSRPGAVCETARRRRIPLRKQDRIRNAPLGERDSMVFVTEMVTKVKVRLPSGDGLIVHQAILTHWGTMNI